MILKNSFAMLPLPHHIGHCGLVTVCTEPYNPDKPYATRLHVLSGYISFRCPVRQTNDSFWGTKHGGTLSNGE